MKTAERQGIWAERCQACGSCMLEKTGGICPITRCSKSLLNGPCGGSTDGKCEINPEIACGWQLIIDRLKELDMLDTFEEIIPMKNWADSRDGGPRKIMELCTYGDGYPRYIRKGKSLWCWVRTPLSDVPFS